MRRKRFASHIEKVVTPTNNELTTKHVRSSCSCSTREILAIAARSCCRRNCRRSKSVRGQDGVARAVIKLVRKVCSLLLAYGPTLGRERTASASRRALAGVG